MIRPRSYAGVTASPFTTPGAVLGCCWVRPTATSSETKKYKAIMGFDIERDSNRNLDGRSSRTTIASSAIIAETLRSSQSDKERCGSERRRSPKVKMSQDIFKVPPQGLPKTVSVLTIVGTDRSRSPLNSFLVRYEPSVKVKTLPATARESWLDSIRTQMRAENGTHPLSGTISATGSSARFELRSSGLPQIPRTSNPKPRAAAPSGALCVTSCGSGPMRSRDSSAVARWMASRVPRGTGIGSLTVPPFRTNRRCSLRRAFKSAIRTLLMTNGGHE